MLNFSLNVLGEGGAVLDDLVVSDRWSPCVLFLSVKFRLRCTEPLSCSFTKSVFCSIVLEGQLSAKSRPEERFLDMTLEKESVRMTNGLRF